MMVHVSWYAGACVCDSGRWETTPFLPGVWVHRFCKPSIGPACRPLSRCYPLSYCPPVLHLCCAGGTGSAQWAICVPSLDLQTRRREDARNGRCAGGDHTHPQALMLPGRHRVSVVEKVTVQLSFFLDRLLLDMKHDATDRFMRDTIRCCNGTE